MISSIDLPRSASAAIEGEGIRTARNVARPGRRRARERRAQRTAAAFPMENTDGMARIIVFDRRGSRRAGSVSDRSPDTTPVAHAPGSPTVVAFSVVGYRGAIPETSGEHHDDA